MSSAAAGVLAFESVEPPAKDSSNSLSLQSLWPAIVAAYIIFLSRSECRAAMCPLL